MKNYKAVRQSISKAAIFDSSEKIIADISWPKAGIWKTQNAPLSEALGDKWQSYPMIDICGKKLRAHRKLLTNRFIVNDFEISLLDESERIEIKTDLKGSRKKIIIKFKNDNYQLIRQSLLNFNFILQKNEVHLCQMRDVTPFLTFSSHREFLIIADQEIEPILLTFSFFIAHNMFF